MRPASLAARPRPSHRGPPTASWFPGTVKTAVRQSFGSFREARRPAAAGPGRDPPGSTQSSAAARGQLHQAPLVGVYSGLYRSQLVSCPSSSWQRHRTVM